ncbi:MAG: hypothetical protein Q7T51_04540 [Candidatus Moranbacteria bacterium]|nr:hypothetical protein [Candidatus Moranbacteria bacterium]
MKSELEKPHPVAWRKIPFDRHEAEEHAIKRGLTRYSVVEESGVHVIYVEYGEEGISD